VCVHVFGGEGFQSNRMRALKHRHIDKTNIQERGSILYVQSIVKKVVIILHMIMVPYGFQIIFTAFKSCDFTTNL